MTGFGRGAASEAGFHAEAELSSVNRKQFDCAVSLPPGLSPLEERCRRLVGASLTRGHAQLTGRVLPEGAAAVAVDETAIHARLAQIDALARATGLPNNVSLRDLLRMPDLMDAACPAPEPDAVWPAVRAAAESAVRSHAEMRRREGAALRADLEARIGRMRALRERIAARAPLVPAAYRDALARRIAELGCPLPPDDPALAREVALLADRCDVSEELTRLAAHFDHAIALFDAPEPAGRKLDFLAQEMHRESNTIGSKANDSQIAAAVIDLQALVETFREQVQNLE